MRIAKHKVLLVIGMSVLLMLAIYVLSPDRISYIRYQSAVDVMNDQKLVGWADNVFLGKVISQTGTKKLGSIPETQFSVEVLKSIKGALAGTVTVNQQGGKEDNQLILLEKDKMLELGKTYLFITRLNKEENWHTLVPYYGDILVTEEAQKGSLVDRFTAAYGAEIPFTFK
ncbi:MAG: hypothetical protein ACYC6I_00915 [Bacillota bacterium]